MEKMLGCSCICRVSACRTLEQVKLPLHDDTALSRNGEIDNNDVDGGIHHRRGKYRNERLAIDLKFSHFGKSKNFPSY